MLLLQATTGEYVGIAKLKKEDVMPFRQSVIDAVATEDYNCWWEDILYRTVDQGEKIYINDVAGKFWAEVDYIEDYQRIKKFVKD